MKATLIIPNPNPKSAKGTLKGFKIFYFVILAFIITGSFKCENSTSFSTNDIVYTGQVEVNGKKIPVNSKCTFDNKTLSYSIENILSEDPTINQKDRLLASFIPRLALLFLQSAEGQKSLLENSQPAVEIQVTMRRKIDNLSKVQATIKITKSNPLKVNIVANIVTPLDGDRQIESDGESVIRIGVNSEKGTFVGGVRINYDMNYPDNASLGNVDFWNVEGSFTGVKAKFKDGFAHVNRCGGDLKRGLVQGTILNFPATTIFESGIITLSGVAKKDGIIHQYKGIANQAGGGSTLFTFPVRIKKGMTGSDVAKLIEEGFTKERENGNNPISKFILAVQGGDGITITASDKNSSRVAVSMTFDNGKTIANEFDERASVLLFQTAVQAFSDQAVLAFENTGIRNQFGIIGSPTLNGWLTPFKAVFSADNPITNNMANGGNIGILLNWSENIGSKENNKENNTDFGDLTIQTKKGESAETIVTRLTEKLKSQKTRWGSNPFIQRNGNIVYIDAGIDFPHSVSLFSNDEGIGYMSAAADLPFFANNQKK